MSDILREIDEDLKREQMEQLWKRYGKYVLIVGVAIVVITSGAMFYKSYMQQQRMAATDHLIEAVDAVQKKGADADILAAFDLAEKSGQDGISLLADFQKAAFLADKGNGTEAAAIYKKLMADGSLEARYQDLAKVLYAQQALATATPEQAADLIELLSDVTIAPNPWRYSAQEVSAMLYVQSNQLDKALELFKNLAASAQAPTAMKQRAQELANFYQATEVPSTEEK